MCSVFPKQGCEEKPEAESRKQIAEQFWPKSGKLIAGSWIVKSQKLKAEVVFFQFFIGFFKSFDKWNMVEKMEKKKIIAIICSKC